MESNRIIQISIIWVIVSLTPLIKSENPHMIKDLDCYNDFDTTIVCFWEVVNSSSDCTRDFHLKYLRTMTSNETWDAVQGSRVSLHNKCIFNISVEPFITADVYKIQVVSQGKPVGHTTHSVKCKVKPKPPLNVRVNLSDVKNSEVLWDVDYKQNFLENKLSFKVQIISKEDRMQTLGNTEERRFPFSKRQLRRGYNYTVRVRAKPSEVQPYGFKGTWSEWSSDVEFRNDYTLTLLDVTSIVIPVFCFLLISLILLSYYFIVRWKKQWWNNIPDPAKSSLSTYKLIQNQHCMPTETSKSADLWERYLKNLVKAHATPQQDHVIRWQNNIRENSTLKKYALEPENEVINSFELCSQEHQICSIQDDVSENEGEAHLSGSDLSIGKMFCDISQDSSGTRIGTFEDLHIGNIFGGFQNHETHVPPSEVFLKMGDHHSHDCGGEDLRRIDRSNPPYTNETYGGKDTSLCISSVEIRDSCTIGEGSTSMNFGYKSFASALSEDT